MLNRQATNCENQIEYDGGSTEEAIAYYREGTAIIAAGKPPLDLITPSTSVTIAHLLDGENQSLAGFSSLNPLESLRSLLKGGLFPNMSSKVKLTIAKAIVSDFFEKEDV